jgi:hypothetical protein
VVLLLASTFEAAAGFSAEMEKQLAESRFVYVQSQRKDGSFSPPAEIWFMVHDGAVWVGTRKTSWRVKRIRAGRPAAKVHALKASGPEFDATMSIVDDPAVWKVMFEAYAKKYADGWAKHEKAFREGADDGSYVLVRYAPK